MALFRTSVVLPYALVVGIVFSGAVVLTASLQLSVTVACCALPLPWLLAAIICRTIRGMPNTLTGVERLSGPTMHRAWGGKRYQLVVMPLNHFGEKVRFVLDLVDAPYEESDVFGILCMLLRGRSVPWLVDRLSCSTIGNSDEILAYIGAVHVPSMPVERRRRAEILLRRTEETMGWEEKLNGLGHAVQGYGYWYVLHPTMSVRYPLTTWGGFEPQIPLFQRLLLRAAAPLLKYFMVGAFKLDGPDAEKLRDARKQKLLDVCEDVDAALKRSGGPFIFGSDMTYVDISFAAIMYPLMDSFMSARDKWAKCRFSSYVNFASSKYAGEHPKTRFKEVAEFGDEVMRRPCGGLIRHVFEQRETKV